MKFYSLLVVLLLIFSASCDDEDAKPPKTEEEVEIVKQEITADLAGSDDLDEFIAAFESLELASEDLESGITIFAPADSGIPGSGGRSGRNSEDAPQLTPEVLKGHIVKGLIEAEGLDDGDILTALNGKSLEVTAIGDDIRINGVLISGKDLASGAKYMIHKVEEILHQAEVPVERVTLEVTVWNGAKWAPEKPKGEIAAGVTVTLYNSREDYVLGNSLHTQETNADGKAIFQDLEAEKTYYVVARKGELSNIFYQSAQPENGVYLGMFPNGIFQSQEEVNTYAVQSDGKPGNFRWKDLNADDKIDNSDKTPVPHEEVIPTGSETQVEIIIGYGNNDLMTIRDGEDALQTLAACYQALNNFHKTMVMTDGMLSDDAECGATANWCAIDNFSFNPSNTTFSNLWNIGYYTIGQLNLLLREVPAINFAEQNKVLAEAKGLRSYIYLQLLTYFGGIPVMEGLTLEEDVARTSVQDVLTLIENDLESVMTVLPVGQMDNLSLISADAVKALLARTALLNKHYETVSAYTTELLQSNRYNLMPNSSLTFSQVNNAEILWDFSFTMSPEFKTYFYDRSFCPAIRLAEVYLMHAEAQFELNNLEAGRSSLNLIRERAGQSGTMGATKEELLVDLRAAWKTEMSREGNRFASLVRWGTASETLGLLGYQPSFHSLLPIPQVFINQHPNLIQNPGY